MVRYPAEHGSAECRRTVLALGVCAIVLYAPLIGWGVPYATAPDRTKTMATDEIVPLKPLERAAPRPSWHGLTLKAGFGAVAAACVLLTGQQTLLRLLLRDHYRWHEPHSGLSFPGLGTDHSYNWFDTYFVERQALAARWLQSHAAPNALVASTPAGSIGYHMDLKVIDMLGLTDRHIAHKREASMGRGRAGHEKGDGQYVLSRSPDYVLLGNVVVLPEPISDADMPKKLVQKSEREIWATPEFHERYERVSVQLAAAGVFTFFQKKGAATSNAHSVPPAGQH